MSFNSYAHKTGLYDDTAFHNENCWVIWLIILIVFNIIRFDNNHHELLFGRTGHVAPPETFDDLNVIFWRSKTLQTYPVARSWSGLLFWLWLSLFNRLHNNMANQCN